ncbi:hypothetical protein PUN28_012991 [Cardiocondyla obscurior]|uniref:Uncharacterized protein n=1 Tax=Cardiocondyla obscurior TaxID=286306 RepID=A0AAW2F7P1_9HYME
MTRGDILKPAAVFAEDKAKGEGRAEGKRGENDARSKRENPVFPGKTRSRRRAPDSDDSDARRESEAHRYSRVGALGLDSTRNTSRSLGLFPHVISSVCRRLLGPRPFNPPMLITACSRGAIDE